MGQKKVYFAKAMWTFLPKWTRKNEIKDTANNETG